MDRDEDRIATDKSYSEVPIKFQEFIEVLNIRNGQSLTPNDGGAVRGGPGLGGVEYLQQGKGKGLPIDQPLNKGEAKGKGKGAPPAGPPPKGKAKGKGKSKQELANGSKKDQ